MGGFDYEVIALLFGAAMIAGCFDAIAGGGGLLTVPALLLAGLDPMAAIATNKLQASAGTLSATAAFARKGLIDWRAALPIAGVALFASALGALSISLLPRASMTAVVPFILIGIALYFAVTRKMSDADAQARLSPLAFTLTVAPTVGFYDGVFGPGAGSFYMLGFVSLLGYGVVRATAQTKLANAASNVGGLCLFAIMGAVIIPLGLVMAVGAFLGAQVGSVLAMRLGSRLIRPLLVIISCVMAAGLLSDPDNPARDLAATWLNLRR